MSKRKCNKIELTMLLLGAVSTGIQLVRLVVDASKNKKEKKSVLDSDYEPDAELEEALDDDYADLDEDDDYDYEETEDGGVNLNLQDGSTSAGIHITNPNIEAEPIHSRFDRIESTESSADNLMCNMNNGGLFGSLFGEIAQQMTSKILDPVQETFQECTVIDNDKDTCLEADEEVDCQEELVDTLEEDIDYGEEVKEHCNLNHLTARYDIPLNKVEPSLMCKLQSTEGFDIKDIETMMYKDSPVYFLPVRHEYASINYFEAVKLLKPLNGDDSISQIEFEKMIKGRYPIKVGSLTNVIVENGFINYWIEIDDEWKHKFCKDSMVIFAYAHTGGEQEIDLIQDAVYITGPADSASLYEYEVIG